MKIDLKWLLVPAGPFVVAGYLRVFVWVFVGEVSKDATAAISSIGVLVGLMAAVIWIADLRELGIRWDVQIGRKRDD